MKKAPESHKAPRTHPFLEKVLKRRASLKACSQIMAFVGAALAAQGIARAQEAPLQDAVNHPAQVGTNSGGAHINVSTFAKDRFTMTWHGSLDGINPATLEAEFALLDDTTTGGVELNLVSPVAPAGDLNDAESAETGYYIRTFREDGRIMERIRQTSDGIIINGENRCSGCDIDSIDLSPTIPGNLRIVGGGDVFDVPMNVSDMIPFTDAAHKVPQLSTGYPETLVVCDQTGESCAATRDVSSVRGARIMAFNPTDHLLRHMRLDTTRTPAAFVQEASPQTVAGGSDSPYPIDDDKEVETASGRRVKLIIKIDLVGNFIFKALVLDPPKPDPTDASKVIMEVVPLKVTTAPVLAYQDSDGDGVADRDDQCPGRAGEQLDIPYVCAADFGEGHFAPDQPADPNNVTPSGLHIGIPEIPEYARVLGGNNASFVWYTDANDLQVTPDELNFFPQPGKFAYAHTAAPTSPPEPEGSVRSIFFPDGHASTLQVLGTNKLDGTPGRVTVLHTPITADDTFPLTYDVPTSEPFELPAGQGDVMVTEGTVVVGDIDEVYTTSTCPPICPPTPDGGTDAGQPATDAGAGDAGTGVPDGGPTPPADGGPTPPADGGPIPPADGGPIPPADGGPTPPADGGPTPPADGGPTPHDGGPIAPDGGPTDANGQDGNAGSPDVPTQPHDGNGETLPDAADGNQDTHAPDGAIIHHHRADEGGGCDCSVSETADHKFSPEMLGLLGLVIVALRKKFRKTIH